MTEIALPGFPRRRRVRPLWIFLATAFLAAGAAAYRIAAAPDPGVPIVPCKTCASCACPKTLGALKCLCPR